MRTTQAPLTESSWGRRKHTHEASEGKNAICWMKMGTYTILVISWCPRHQGIIGNEKVDELAESGSKLPNYKTQAYVAALHNPYPGNQLPMRGWTPDPTRTAHHTGVQYPCMTQTYWDGRYAEWGRLTGMIKGINELILFIKCSNAFDKPTLAQDPNPIVSLLNLVGPHS